MARRKNTKRFDPRYFMSEKMEILSEGESLEVALQASEQNGQRTERNSTGGGGGMRYPVIKVSNNQYIQLSQFIQYQGNQPVVSGYHVDFSTAPPSGPYLSGRGRIGKGEGVNGAEAAVESALTYIQQAAEKGQGPYGTEPIDTTSVDPGVTTQ